MATRPSWSWPRIGSRTIAAKTPVRLALLPGLDGTGLLFEPLISVLPPELDPLVVQYPRHSAGSITDHVDAATAALSAGKRWLLLAESFSGPVAARMITENRELDIAGVVFCASFLSPPRRSLLALARRAPLQAIFGMPLPDWVLRTFCLGAQADRSTIALARRALSCAGPQALAARLRMLSGLPAFRDCITVPALYIRGPAIGLSGPRACMMSRAIAARSTLSKLGDRISSCKLVRIPAPRP